MKTVFGFLFFALPGLLLAGSFEQADSVRRWSFPRDHGHHSSYAIEWWYLTSLVSDSIGQDYGIQVTFFRRALSADPVYPQSAWSVRDIYFAHAVISDLSTGKVHVREKRSRTGPELAGSDSTRLSVRIHDWEMYSEGNKWVITVQTDSFLIDLETIIPDEPVFHGNQGLSRKGPEEASYYYSYPRLKTTGILRIDGKPVSIHGRSWFDHEFSSQQLPEASAGWDWFGLCLDDGSDLMVYLLRQPDGAFLAESGGTWHTTEGTKTFKKADLKIHRIRYWTSDSGARYPIEWTVAIPELDLEITVSARHPHHELKTKESTLVVYWEGPVTVSGTRSGLPVTGEGYMELTGYAHPLNGF
jgi:predicted secreted hydrolase